MESETSLGNPIPTGIITPSEILPAVETAPDELKRDAVQSPPGQPPVETSVNFLAEIMFAPILFWASLSASCLRFFDAASRDAMAPHRNG